MTSEHTLERLSEPDSWRVRFVDRARVRGKQNHQPVFEIFDADPPGIRESKQKNLELFEMALAHYHLGDLAGARERLNVCHERMPGDKPTRMYLEYCNAPSSGNARIELTEPWRLEFATGDKVVDAEHQTMLSGLNALARAVYLGSSNLIPLLLPKIISAAERNFAAEETLMRANQYAFSELHLRQHRHFLATLSALEQELTIGSDDPILTTFHIRQRLIDWLIDHILTADRHLTYRHTL